MPKYQLMKHQRKGVKFLDKMDGVGALLFDPGVGKTGTTLAWADKMPDEYGGEFRVLVVAPLTAADTWVLQAPLFMDSVVKARLLEGSTLSIMEKMGQARDWVNVPKARVSVDHPGPKHTDRVTILSISAGAISSFCKERTKTLQMLKAVRRYSPHLIVVDESHIIKAPESNISKAMYPLGQLAPHRIILTGTVNPKDILDVYGQWRFLAPWTFSDQYGKKYTRKPTKMTRSQMAKVTPWPWGRFKARYTVPGGYGGLGVGGFINEDELRDRIAERSMVVRKEDALDLPPVTDIPVHVTLSPREAKAYKEMAEELAMEADSGEIVEAVNALAKLMKLRQIASGFVKDTTTDEVHVIGSSLRKAVKEVVEVQLASEKRVVVFAYFRREVELIAESLRKKGVTVEEVTGSTPNKERLAIRQRFGDVSRNPGRMILVAQQRTMSLSVNELITAQHGVFASMSERREDWVQARGRLDRNGQKGSHVTFWNVFSPGLVGEIMLDRHRDRGNLEKALLEHVREVAKRR